MSGSQDTHASPWLATMDRPDLGDTSFRELQPDVVVVGAGICGLTAALLLQQAGRSVVVVEARRLGESVTTHSTVKVTVGHGTVYSQIAQKRGMEAARVYADANQAGFDTILELSRTLALDCMLERGLPHVIYAESEEQVEQVEREAAVAHQVGLPVSLTRETPLPFAVPRAVSFAAQAQFHPGRYLAGLAAAFVGAGGTLIESARATDVSQAGDGCRVETSAGPLSAAYVVVATQYPFLDRGGQFTQLEPRRSYGIAGVLPEHVPGGMTMNVGSPTHSTRTARLQDEDLLIVVGEGHKVGHVTETGERWDRLRDWAGERFGVTQFRYHWSAEEVSTLDGIPFVGQIAPVSSRVLTATGFAGWGMTNGTAAALMLRDVVLGQDNPWLTTFDARRALTSVPPIAPFLKQNVQVAKLWLQGRLAGAEDGTPTDLQPGDAAILEVDGKQTAAFRDHDGCLHAVSAVCTHLKCTVAWNAGETSWDCPCHGSRFSHTGEVLHGPAITPLEPRELPGA
jgi:glycine/D-amino acid oxidase-like deaminating enzyme/nitrite reductase/ring-hydroxylating ferredoxin subunit